ncbi:MAG: hypothetical protein ACRENA_04595 [Vulcanimicrobiaceae bacterium]
MHPQRFVATILTFTFALLSVPAGAAAPTNPFAFGASVGPSAASRVDAYVTRTVDGKRVTLPAGAVPALQPGDDVNVSFPDYTRPPAKVNYHVNVAFITETPPAGWLFQRSNVADRLFATPSHRRGVKARPPSVVHFTYGKGNYRGIPIFFIVPEDGKTRGMDGVRDYVEAHPTDFKNMSVSSNDAIERYSWFRDFLSSLSQGAVDPTTQQQRVEAIAQSLGASPDSINACYYNGATPGQIDNCIQTTMLSIQYQTNIEAPTQAQFFGGVAGASLPVTMALYLQPLLAVWKIFSRNGHKEYEYLPTTLNLTTPVMPGATNHQLLMGLKVPTLRPPAAFSSVLFFTIGDPDAVANPPDVQSDDKGTGMCATDARVKIPVHLDKTSGYVNDTELTFTGESGASAVHLPLDPRAAAAPLVDRSRLTPGRGYDVKLSGRFGFNPLRDSTLAVAHVAVPGDARWNVSTVAYHPSRSGGQLDAVASSEVAPCLSNAELQMGGNAPIPLNITRLDDRRVELTGSLQSVPAGVAQLRFYQHDAAGHRQISDATPMTILPHPAQVSEKTPPVAYVGDRAILLQGAGLESIHGVRIGKATYAKTSGSDGDAACFTGPAIGGDGIAAGTEITAELMPDGNDAGQAFPLQLQPGRPQLAHVRAVPDNAEHVASDQLTLALSSGSTPLPRKFDVRLRQAPAVATPCDALRSDPTAVDVPPADIRRTSLTAVSITLKPSDVLHDDALGTVQAQIVDQISKRESDWMSLPGQFVFSPPPTLPPKPTPSPSPSPQP